MLRDIESIKKLAEKLSHCREVAKHDTEGDPEAWRLAHSFFDLEESFKKITELLLPRLYKEKDDSLILPTLLDIGEELRHVLYHIQDPRFFRYLIETDINSK